MSGYHPPPGPPPQQFGQPQQGWGGPPPPQQFGGQPGQFQHPPPQQQWGPPAHGQQFAPPQGPPPGFNQGPPPGQPGFQQFPPQQGFHQPPPQQAFQQPPPQQPPQQAPAQAAQPSPGYGTNVAQGNADPDVDALIKAMGGLKRDHTTIIKILANKDPLHMALLRQTWTKRTNGGNLDQKVSSAFSNNYGSTLTQLARGPLLADVHNAYMATKGLGTKEDMLDDVLIGRSNADMRAIKAMYQKVHHTTLEEDVEGDLSAKTKTMYQLIMRASRTEESYPYNPAEVSRDAEALHNATKGGSSSTNQEAVFTIITQRSDNQLRAITQEFQNKYHKSLEDTIRSSFSGHMEAALLLALGRATDRAKTDAYGLEETMKGFGTKDQMLINETVRIHWDRQHLDQVKKAYQHFFKKDLLSRVKGETSGDYRSALLACLT